MAATFVVEDGTGVAGANSYLAVADADQYWENHGNPSSWSTAQLAAKQAALRLGTQYLDAIYGDRWIGYKAFSEQPLDWPRFEAFDPDGWAREGVPPEVKDALAELARRSIDGDTLVPDAAAVDRNVVSESVGAGPVQQSKTYAGTKATEKGYSIVDRILRPVIIAGTEAQRA